jgi:hypothetical protein
LAAGRSRSVGDPNPLAEPRHRLVKPPLHRARAVSARAPRARRARGTRAR